MTEYVEIKKLNLTEGNFRVCEGIRSNGSRKQCWFCEKCNSDDVEVDVAGSKLYLTCNKCGESTK